MNLSRSIACSDSTEKNHKVWQSFLVRETKGFRGCQSLVPLVVSKNTRNKYNNSNTKFLKLHNAEGYRGAGAEQVSRAVSGMQ